MCACSVLVICSVGAVGTPPIRQLVEFTNPPNAEAIHQALAEIPANASVCAQGHIAPHLSHRLEIYTFPQVNEADFVVLDLHGNVWPLSESEYRDSVRETLQSGYAEKYSRDGVLLLARR